ncbi:uncharacterized protein BDZ99DRAFT_452746 [Mytilinidion resinicola]|uniref:Uncharacterized protein n=1 Tax=Mytilinidion resinicola TaxID=574789 RepID=A0A6A6Y4I0_9PEZI|nr:uncharacterized protein BDZ99DRAFT_452746 [Mytilinidion resinicola]KAF2803706.1 hypothetical protein BDZ99DRAFT_452746 [Mytilinidion resinicola]
MSLMRISLPHGRPRFRAIIWQAHHRQFRRKASSAAKESPESLEPLVQDVHLRKASNRPLPIPPVLKPMAASIKPPWKEPKPDPDLNNLTPFQKKLYQNPYAHALATPVRLCSATLLRLPSDLLLSMQVKLHPTTEAPWLVPAALASKSNNHGVPVRYLAQESMILYLTRNKREPWKYTLPLRIVENLGSAIKKLVWREDMPALLLSILRKQLVANLRWFFGKTSNHLVPCESQSPTDVDHIDDVSCILCLRTLTTGVDHLHTELTQIVLKAEQSADKISKRHRQTYDTSKTSSDPPPHVPRLKPSLRFPPLHFPTAVWRGRRVPVYSLIDLLGEEHLAELIKDTKFQDEKNVVVMRESRIAVSAQIKLMQLQAYLAKPMP